jgi:hypothetical protein
MDTDGEIRRFTIYCNKSTGLVIGLICLRCSIGLEILGDSANRLIRAAEFLLSEPAPIPKDVEYARAHIE